MLGLTGDLVAPSVEEAPQSPCYHPGHPHRYHLQTQGTYVIVICSLQRSDVVWSLRSVMQPTTVTCLEMLILLSFIGALVNRTDLSHEKINKKFWEEVIAYITFT
jgi:hypothetical protein